MNTNNLTDEIMTNLKQNDFWHGLSKLVPTKRDVEKHLKDMEKNVKKIIVATRS
jgi:hypothetical protein